MSAAAPSPAPSLASGETQPARGRVRAIVAALLLVHALLLLDAARRDSVTFDELHFIGGGVVLWSTGDQRFLPEASVIPQRLAGLLPFLAGARPSDGEGWATGDIGPIAIRLFSDGPLAPGTLTLLARLPFIALAVALAALTWALARRLLGDGAALLALLVHALSPAFLGNGHLATTDAPFTLAFLAAAWLIGRCLERVTPGRVAASAAVTSLAFLTKVSAVLLGPIALLLALVHLATGRPFPLARERRVRSLAGRIGLIAGLVAVHAAVAVLAIWLAHGLRFEPAASDLPYKEGGWTNLASAGAAEAPLRFAREHRLLPDAYLFGFQHVLKHSMQRRSYALGRVSDEGWWWFFPLAFALKTPLSALALMALGLAAWLSSWRRGERFVPERGGIGLARERSCEGGRAWARTAWGSDILPLAPLLALAAVYWLVAMRTHLNIGFRHVLPTLPVAFLLAGAAFRWAQPGQSSRLRPALVAALSLLVVLEGALAQPSPLAHQNALGGPPAARWRRLVDSSLDWGQDARRISEALDEEAAAGAPALHVARFASDPWRLHDDRATELPGFFDLRGDVVAANLAAGSYVISATTLAQVYTNFPGRWAREYETQWQRARTLAAPYLAADAAGRAALELERGSEYWTRLLRAHEQIRMARLCSWLRHEPPDRVLGGGATLVFRLDASELEQALDGPPREFIDMPEASWAGSPRGAGP